MKRRLLHLEERLDIQRVELTHDVLTPVVKKSRDQRQQQEAVLRAEQHARQVREETRRWRNKQLIIVAGVAAAMLVGITTGAAYYANQQRQKANEQRQKANENYEAARETVVRLVVNIAQKLRDRGIPQDAIEEALNQVVGLVDNLEAQNQGDPELKRIRALMHFEFAKVFQNSNFLPRAQEEAEKGLQIRRELVAPPSVKREWLSDLAQSLDQAGDIHRETAKEYGRRKPPDPGAGGIRRLARAV